MIIPMQRPVRSLLPAIVGATVFAATAAAAPPSSVRLWTPTKADAVLLLKLRLPCPSVRSRANCSLSSAQRRLAACSGRKASRCATSAGGDPSLNLSYVRKGFPLRSAVCTSGGKGHGRGGRFSVFQCRVTVYDDGNPGDPVVVSGRLLVTVTGATTFRWQAL
jgi:hypothetical protein